MEWEELVVGNIYNIHRKEYSKIIKTTNGNRHSELKESVVEIEIKENMTEEEINKIIEEEFQTWVWENIESYWEIKD